MQVKSRPGFEDFEQIPFQEFTRKAYLNYSMYVILDRALPHIGDGLKPVQRRIVYSMSQLGLSSTAKFKKSARTVGDVLGKFHPHGDSACYEAMVLLAQPFSQRYPLVDGQGNWGDPNDPKSFAAMRYTESRLTGYADLFLSEIEQGAVDWVPNFDGSLEEPFILPARLPNLLLNGTTGIAVGMATSMLPHNLREVANALCLLIDEPDAGLDAICKFIKGPDFPTEAEIITPVGEIKSMYRTGNGKIKTRARYHVEDGDIVIDALPFHASGEKIYEQIAAQIEAKKLPMVSDVRDESDHENPTRLVIMPKTGRVDKDLLINHLFATTDLEKSYAVNMNMIGINGRPAVKNLKTFLTEWLVFRTDMVRKKLNFRLSNVIRRLHILDGLLTAYIHIDEIIAVIRHSEHPKEDLIKAFSLSEDQARSILEIRLRQLARLEEMKIRQETEQLETEKTHIETILGSEIALRSYIKDEIQSDAKIHGDKRRSPIKERKEAEAFSEIDVIDIEPVTVILTKNGWIRSAKGHEIEPDNLKYKSGDSLLSCLRTKSDSILVFLDSEGRSYTLTAHTLPSARGLGEPLTGRLGLSPHALVQFMFTGQEKDLFLVASESGYGFIVEFSDFLTKNRNGKAVILLKKGFGLMPPAPVTDFQNDTVCAITSKGRLLVFPVNQMPRLNKGKGNKIISIPGKEAGSPVPEKLKFLHILPARSELVLHCKKHFLKLTPGNLKEYTRLRGYRGKQLPRGYQEIDSIEIRPIPVAQTDT